MLETGFLSAALALVGIVPTREAIHSDSQIPMTPMPGLGVARPTMTDSPRPQAASASVMSAMPMAAMPVMPATAHSIDVMAMARIPDGPAVEFFIDDWIDVCGETVGSLDDLLRGYKELRRAHSFLPPVSKKRLSQLLAANGSRRFIQDSKDAEGQRHRVVYFEMRERKSAQRRAA